MKGFGVIAPDHKLAAQLGKQSLNAFSGFPQGVAERSKVKLVAAYRRLQPNVGSVKQALLVLADEVTFINDQDAAFLGRR